MAKPNRAVIEQANIFIVTLRPDDKGDLGIESIIHVTEVGTDSSQTHPNMMRFRHRYNPDMRSFWYPAPAGWTKEDVVEVFEGVSPDKRREYYNSGVNLG